MRRIPALLATVSLLAMALAPVSGPASAQARMTRLKLSYGESQFIHFHGDFRFPMNGIAWGGAYVSACGLVSFECPLEMPVPTAQLFSISSPAVAPLWATLDPSSGGEILVGHPDADRFEVRFVDVPVIPSSFPGPDDLELNATLTLHRDGRIDVAFGSTVVETALVGWTAGRAYADPPPPPVDLSHAGDPIGTASDTAVFEWFPAGAFDLSGRTLHFRAPGTAGGRLGISNNESVFVRFPPGFTFPFETFPYAGAWIGANGYVAFGGRGFTDPTHSAAFVNEHVYIAPLWTDLNIDAGAVAVNMLDTTELQIEWRDVVDRLTGQVLTYRLHLYPTGHFEFDYDQVDGALGLAGFSAGHVRTGGVGHEIDLSAQNFVIPDDGRASAFDSFTLYGPADLSYRRFRFEPRRTSSDLISLGDDGFVEVVFPDGFVFPMAGRHHDRMFVNSNGNVTFESSDTTWIESVPRFLGGFPRIAPFWDDLNPSVQGAVRVNLQTPGSVSVAWENVPEFLNTGSNSASVTLNQDGTYTILYDACTLLDALTGHSGGGQVNDGTEPASLLVDHPDHPDRGAPAWYQKFPWVSNFDLSGQSLSAAGMGGLVRAGQARTGQRLDLTVQQDRAVAGWCVVAASRSTSPGIDVLGLHVPLTVDPLLVASLLPSPYFLDFQGNLDPSGVMRPALLIPEEPALVGQTIYLGDLMLYLDPVLREAVWYVEPTATPVTFGE